MEDWIFDCCYFGNSDKFGDICSPKLWSVASDNWTTDPPSQAIDPEQKITHIRSLWPFLLPWLMQKLFGHNAINYTIINQYNLFGYCFHWKVFLISSHWFCTTNFFLQEKLNFFQRRIHFKTNRFEVSEKCWTASQTFCSLSLSHHKKTSLNCLFSKSNGECWTHVCKTRETLEKGKCIFQWIDWEWNLFFYPFRMDSFWASNLERNSAFISSIGPSYFGKKMS